MTIGKRLYYGFGAMLVLLAFLFVVSFFGWNQQRKSKTMAKNTLEEVRAIEAVRTQMVQNRLALGNYLLSGDTREVDKVTAGIGQLNDRLKQASDRATTDQVRSTISLVRDLEANWKSSFADPLIDKRKQVDAGNATVAELQIFYLQQDPNAWLEKSQKPLDDALKNITAASVETSNQDDSTSTWSLAVTSIVFVLAVISAIVIAFLTNK
ncbi:MAG TPA: MCP four helix bundle domain-containing protein, partial [Terriglobales bacterium]|nr:MCP four helix bundle domain-containing protein [Terriglobales bacterium]